MEAPGEITFEQIRGRTYDLWERNHRPDGFEIEFWLMADRELKAERDSRLNQLAAKQDKTLPHSPSVRRFPETTFSPPGSPDTSPAPQAWAKALSSWSA